MTTPADPSPFPEYCRHTVNCLMEAVKCAPLEDLLAITQVLMDAMNLAVNRQIWALQGVPPDLLRNDQVSSGFAEKMKQEVLRK